MSSYPVTAIDVVEEIRRISDSLTEAHVELNRLSHEWAQKEAVYRLAKANAFLAAEGTVQAREATRDKVTDQERREAHLSEALLRSQHQLVQSIRAQLSAAQTAASALKAEMSLAGGYGE